jgi:outer membrane protein assembly factor BamA
VFDNSVFGGTSPVLGQRYRFSVEPVLGSLNFTEILGDYRRYVPLMRPLTIAGRVLHFGRYGSDGEDARLTPLFVGYPSLVRGYDLNSFATEEPIFDQLLGSKLAVANVELRLPLLGTLGLLPSPGVPPLEAALFFDAGSAWTDAMRPSFLGGDARTVTSHGLALRLNLFGFAIGEVDLVHPNDRTDKGWYWLFSIQPGF